jgi:uncharacterized membrane protein YhhN
MTGLAWVALLAAAAFGVTDWIAKARGDRRTEYFAKPLTILYLILVATSLHPANTGQRGWFVVALVFSLAGDIFLMVPSDQFVAGLASFLVAHVCYVIGFWVEPPSVLAFVVAAVIVVVIVAPLAVRIVSALRASGEGALAGPVIAYITVISAMVASALASGNVVAGAGAVLFAASDAMIAWDRFVGRLRFAPVAIMVTYHVGQALLVLSLLT